MFQGNSTFDENHCLREYNEFSIYHNRQLRGAIEKLKKENPGVTIVYGNLYHALQRVFSRATYLGMCFLILSRLNFKLVCKIFDFLQNVAYILKYQNYRRLMHGFE